MSLLQKMYKFNTYIPFLRGLIWCRLMGCMLAFINRFYYVCLVTTNQIFNTVGVEIKKDLSHVRLHSFSKIQIKNFTRAR